MFEKVSLSAKQKEILKDMGRNGYIKIEDMESYLVDSNGTETTIRWDSFKRLEKARVIGKESENNGIEIYKKR